MKIVGHRGAKSILPENTLCGFHYLKNHGMGAVEFDVRQLIDGHLCVIHDDNFIRTSGVDKTVEQSSLSELTNINQSWHFKDFIGFEKTPLLSEVLAVVGDFYHIEIEVKPVSTQENATRLIRTLHHEIRQYVDDLTPITITSFDVKILQALSDYPHLKKGLLFNKSDTASAIRLAKELDYQRIGWDYTLATPDVIDKSHQAGLAVSVWTVNDKQLVNVFKNLGVDALITDNPVLMSKAD
ncbi:MAG: glycerophosphodiester phosphodiesterase family protein [Moraxella sp.]|nr:glycerophosphodiester phosphodiesterase family protein [Moraxella sp.]